MERSVAAGLDDGQSNMLLLRPTASRVHDGRARETAGYRRHPHEGRGPVHGGDALLQQPGGDLRGAHRRLRRGRPRGGGEPRGGPWHSPEGAALALFAASGIGWVMARRASFSAELAGCQVEIGVAGAMAAAAVVESAGGRHGRRPTRPPSRFRTPWAHPATPWPAPARCPVTPATRWRPRRAFTCADLILGGYANPIPLDETIDASYEVGKALPSELRCTARGGCAVTPSALALRRLR